MVGLGAGWRFPPRAASGTSSGFPRLAHPRKRDARSRSLRLEVSAETQSHGHDADENPLRSRKFRLTPAVKAGDHKAPRAANPPHRRYGWGMRLLAMMESLLGLGGSLVLTRAHIAGPESAEGGLCGALSETGCSIAIESGFGTFVGMPLSVWALGRTSR